MRKKQKINSREIFFLHGMFEISDALAFNILLVIMIGDKSSSATLPAG